MASLGPESVPSQGGPEDWAVYALKAVTLPLAVFAIGAILALTIFSCLCFGLECECRMLPRTPWLLLIWGLATFGVVGLGMVRRQVATGRTLALAQEMFEHLEINAKNAGMLAQSLDQVCADVDGILDHIPATCHYFLKDNMEDLIEKVENQTNTMCSTVVEVNALLHYLQGGLGLVKEYGDTWALHFYWMPLVPLLLILSGCLVTVVSTMLTWFNPHTHVGDVSDCILDKIGSWGFATCILVVAGLTAVYLELGIVSGAFCANVDDNVIGIVHHVDWTQFRKNHKTVVLNRNVQAMAEGTASYYVYGTSINPLEQMLLDVKSHIWSLDKIWNKTDDYVIPPAEFVCDGIDNIDFQVYVNKAVATVNQLDDFVKPIVVWPYYKSVVQDMMCGSVIHGVGDMIILNVLVGFFMMPVLALLADIDLRKWMAHKDTEYDKVMDGRTLVMHGEVDSPASAEGSWNFHHPRSQPGYHGH